MSPYYYLPVAVIIVANIFYNLCTKSMPVKANPFFCLVITYLIAAFFAFLMYTISRDGRTLSQEVPLLNWAPFVLGVSLVALEFGYILLYRVGWNISIGSLVCNIILAIILLGIGLLVYREMLSARQVFGGLLCIAGLFFINK